LLSVGQLYNKGYYATFKIDGVSIFNSAGKAILKGHSDLCTGLWRNNLRSDKPHTQIAEENNIYELHNTGALFNYLQKSMSSPTNSALHQAVKRGHLTTWPGLTEDAINKNLRMTPATEMGHMNQTRQNIRSTKKEIKSDLGDDIVTLVSSGMKIHFLVYTLVIDQGQIYTDLTVIFPQRSSKRNCM
jgi:hypothetical protein